ncbi:MAG TPA: signal peptidase I [Solirubrobacteraceae bacterium]|jgi:signal peptidase
MTALRHLGRGAATLVTGVAVLAAVCVGVAMWAGYRPQPVLSGSMEPHLPIGSLTIAKAVPATSVRVGDVITFQRPNGERGTITHRVHRIVESGGRRIYTTKGDANPSPDPWQLQLPGQVGRNVADVPYAGYVVIVAALPQSRAGLIAVFTLLLIFGAVRAIWRGDRTNAATA